MFRRMSTFFHSPPRLAPICALLLLLCAQAPARDRSGYPDDVPPPPPEPNPLVVEVPRGGPVWITLSAYSLTSPIIRYRIRRQTEYGKLGTPELVTVDTARVKYTLPPGSGPGEDSFSYQIQSMGGVSAAAEVRIKITDKDPQLIAPDQLDFGAVLPGGSSSRLLVIQNIGGGLAEGVVKVPDGWSVEGDPGYRLSAGAKQSFTLVFKPAEKREYMGDVEYTSDLERATDLVGSEVAPIVVAPGPIELLQAGNSRVGNIHVENRTDKPCTLRVIPGPVLITEAELIVPAKGSAEILVQAKPGKDAEIHDTVAVEGEGIRASVGVHAGAVQQIEPAPMLISQAATPAQTPRPAPPADAVAPAPAQAAPNIPVPPAFPDDLTPLPPSTSEETGQPMMMTVSQLGISMSRDDVARLQCRFPNAQAVRSWRVELETVGIDAHGKPAPKWVPYENATVTASGQTVTVDMAHLQPNALYVVRVTGADSSGKIVAFSSIGEIWTVPAKRTYWRWILLTVVVLAAAGLWIWKRRAIP